MSIVSMLQELTRGETWGNKEQFERNYYEGKKVLDDTYCLNYKTFYDVKFITSIYSKNGLVKEYPFSYDSEICKELERKYEA